MFPSNLLLEARAESMHFVGLRFLQKFALFLVVGLEGDFIFRWCLFCWPHWTRQRASTPSTKDVDGSVLTLFD